MWETLRAQEFASIGAVFSAAFAWLIGGVDLGMFRGTHNPTLGLCLLLLYWFAMSMVRLPSSGVACFGKLPASFDTFPGCVHSGWTDTCSTHDGTCIIAVTRCAVVLINECFAGAAELPHRHHGGRLRPGESWVHHEDPMRIAMPITMHPCQNWNSINSACLKCLVHTN